MMHDVQRVTEISRWDVKVFLLKTDESYVIVIIIITIAIMFICSKTITNMSVLLLVGRNVSWPRRMLPPGESQ